MKLMHADWPEAPRDPRVGEAMATWTTRGDDITEYGAANEGRAILDDVAIYVVQ